MPVSDLLSIIENFSAIKVLVVGDVMLDRYWWGSVRRISPEAPVPVVNLEKTSLVAGGAANVAVNIAGLGAQPFLVGMTGEDEEAQQLSKVLESLNVSTKYLVKTKKRPTTIKTRIIAHSQQVVRIDQENSHLLDSLSEKKIINLIEKNIDQAHIVLVSDYAKGVISESIVARLINIARQLKKPIFIDPKGRDYSKYAGATLLTPNQQEAATACNLEMDEPDLVQKAGSSLIDEFDLEAVLITQGEKGMTLFERNKTFFHLETLARKVYDVTGAGDTVIASLGVACGAGAELAKASEIANIAAGLVVEEVGTTAVNIKSLKRAVNTK